MQKCDSCHGSGIIGRISQEEAIYCDDCGGIGHKGVPIGPTNGRPGSEEKLVVMCARYRAGIPLFHIGDRL